MLSPPIWISAHLRAISIMQAKAMEIDTMKYIADHAKDIINKQIMRFSLFQTFVRLCPIMYLM